MAEARTGNVDRRVLRQTHPSVEPLEALGSAAIPVSAARPFSSVAAGLRAANRIARGEP